LLIASLVWSALFALEAGWWNRPVEVGPRPSIIPSVSYSAGGVSQAIDPVAVDADLTHIARRARAIRTYSAREEIVAAARKHGLKVWHGAWLDTNREGNAREIAAVIEQARKYPETIERVIVGSEVLLRGELSAEELIENIRKVKAAVAQPVTYADAWAFWLRNRDVFAAVDEVVVHFFPYWEEVPLAPDQRDVKGAIIETFLLTTLRQARWRAAGKPVLVGETGWPTDGRTRGRARPGRVEAARYLALFEGIANREGVSYNLVEAFDQPWKAGAEGTVGARWGLFDTRGVENLEPGRPVVPDPSWIVRAACAAALAALACVAFGVRAASTVRGVTAFAGIANVSAALVVGAAWTDLSRAMLPARIVVAVLSTTGLVLLGGSLLVRVAARLDGSTRPGDRDRDRAGRLLSMLIHVFTAWAIFDAVALALDGRYRDYPGHRLLLPAAAPFLYAFAAALGAAERGRAFRAAGAAFSHPASGLRTFLHVAAAAALLVGAGAMIFVDGTMHVVSKDHAHDRWLYVSLFANVQADLAAACCVALAFSRLAAITRRLRLPEATLH
jgi:exo-beta-1,3-glucanase (GH17 family)